MMMSNQPAPQEPIEGSKPIQRVSYKESDENEFSEQTEKSIQTIIDYK